MKRIDRKTIVWIAVWVVLFAAKCALVTELSANKVSPDEMTYRSLATGMIEGEGLSREGKPTAMVVPGFPLIVAGILSVAPDSEWFPFAVNVLFSLILSFGFGGLLALLTGRGHLFKWGALVVFLYPQNIQYAAVLITEMSHTAFFVVALLMWELMRRRTCPLWRWPVFGLIWAAAFLIRPATLTLTPVLLLWVLVSGRFHWRVWLGCALAVVGIMALWAPWIMRNYRAFDEVVPLTNYSGITLYAGTLEDFKAFDPLYKEELARVGIDDYFEDEYRSNQFLTGLAHERISEDRVGYLLRSVKRSWRYWIHDYPWHVDFAERFRAASSPRDYLPLIARPILQLQSVILLAALLWSIWVLRARWDCWPYILVIAHHTAMHAMMFPIIRYSFPVQCLAVVLIWVAVIQVRDRRSQATSLRTTSDHEHHVEQVDVERNP